MSPLSNTISLKARVCDNETLILFSFFCLIYSKGGAAALLATLKKPEYFKGVIISSPFVIPPKVFSSSVEVNVTIFSFINLIKLFSHLLLFNNP